MIFSRLVVFFFSICLALLTAIPMARSQNLPLQGPGLGNLTYTDAELFKEISEITWNSGTYTNGIPEMHPPTNAKRPYGNNVGIMLNGYMLTMFAQDGGYPVGGFQMYDISNPRDIKLKKTVYDPQGKTSDFREPHSFGSATINGRDYIAIQSAKGVEFWDFTDINDIKQVKKLALSGVNGGDYENVAWQLWWQAPYLYVASGARGIFIIDAKDPANAKLADRGNGLPNPVPTGQLGGFRIGPIFAMGNQMVVSTSEGTAGFSRLDISDPLNPVVLNVQGALPKYYASCFNGKKLYTSGRSGSGKLAGFDLSGAQGIKLENKDTPIEEGLYCTTQDKYLFVGAQRHVFKLDATDPQNYVEVGRTEKVANPSPVPPLGKTDPDLGQVSMFGNLMFVGSDHGYNTAFRPHQKAKDTTAPTVLAVSPANGAQQQAVTSRIGLGLSDSILPETVNSQKFIVRKKGGAQVSGTYSVQLGIINFSPTAPLAARTEYEVVLTAGGLKDYAGNAIAQQYISTFKTGNVSEAPSSYTNRWPLVSSLEDAAGSNDGVATSADVYKDGGLDFSARTTGVQLTSDAIANVLGRDATVTFNMKTGQVGSSAPLQSPGIFGRNQTDGSSGVFWGHSRHFFNRL